MKHSVHLEGMGVLGCLLALRLEQLGISFTWNDKDAPVNAWVACTGCIYPSGDDFDMDNYVAWQNGFCGLATEEFQRATYFFLSKRPPHGGKYAFWRDGVFGISSLPSFHVNVQSLVPRVRARFAKRRVKPRHGQLHIVSHGFGKRLFRYMWGWTVKVRLSFQPSLLEGTTAACLYMRVGRYKLAYAYPIPGERGWYYAGSSLITQGVARSLEVEPKYNVWLAHVLKTTGIKVIERGAALEGWRPVAAPADDALVERIDDALHVKPLWSSGLRHAPAVVDATVRLIAK